MASESELHTRASLLFAVRDPCDSTAWAAFNTLYGGPIQHWALKMGLSPNDADELSQDVLVKLLDEMPRFEYDPKKKFRGWLRRVVSTAVVDRYREHKRRPGDRGIGGTAAHELLREVEDTGGFGEMLEELEDRLERGRVLAAACEHVKGRTDERTWEMFMLLILDSLKAPEVAKRYEISVTAVYAAKSRVLKMIREKISQIG